MSGPSETSNPVIFGVTPSATFLPASASGRTRSAKPDLETLDLFGPAVVPVSPSVPPANSAVTTTTATSGPSGSSSSASANLTSSLVSRLSKRFATAGSTLFTATWKTKATPLGLSYMAHTASVPRTNANVSTSWPSPAANNFDGDLDVALTRRAKMQEAQGNNGFGLTTAQAAQLATWPTPNGDDANNATRASGSYQSLTRAANQATWVTPAARDWKDTMGMVEVRKDGRGKIDQLPRQAHALVPKAAWPTPQAIEQRETPEKKLARGASAGLNLAVAAQYSAWTTPQAHDSSPRGKGQKLKHGTTHGCADLNADAQASGPTSDGSTVATASAVRFRLNPRFSLWLMSIPPDAWVSCAVRAMHSLRKRPRRSSQPTSTTTPTDE